MPMDDVRISSSLTIRSSLTLSKEPGYFGSAGHVKTFPAFDIAECIGIQRNQIDANFLYFNNSYMKIV